MITSVFAGYVTAIVLITAIGAQNAFVLRQGLRREHVLPVVVICVLSDALLVSLGIAGLGSVISAHPDLVGVARWGCATFLVVYALLAIRRATRPESLVPWDRPPTALGPTLLACLGFTYLNPHVYLDTVVFLGTVANQDTHRWWFGLGCALASASWFAVLGFGAQRIAPMLSRQRAWQFLEGGIAAVMLLVAVPMIVA